LPDETRRNENDINEVDTNEDAGRKDNNEYKHDVNEDGGEDAGGVDDSKTRREDRRAS